MKRQIVLLREQNTEGSSQSLSEQNSSECILNEENELSTLSDNLTACLEDRDEKLSFISQEKALLNTKVRKTSEELLRLCHLFKNASCPEDWEKVNCSCYITFGPGTWDEARKDCISKGGDLLVIEDEDELNRLYEKKQKPGYEAWIGLTDRETEGSWQWLDGYSMTSKLSETYQPDGDSKQEEKDCAQIRKNDDGWD
ncbi:CD209 antigen-like protein A [Cyprinodon tularosa]|uniref:CD209 antigen-like protein A n=1 Tax=Cyprinodon tularosa TaxID=77115 RepID=UPI0018E22CF9|nr:CD209 antigen-like protein A [Cyprinodon tularosa]